MRKITIGALAVACSMALAAPALAQDSTTNTQGGHGTMPVYTPGGKQSVDPVTGAPVGVANPAPGNGAGTTGAAPVRTDTDQPPASASEQSTTRHDPPGTRAHCRTDPGTCE